MRIDPDKPGLLGLLRGEGDEPALIVLAWVGTLVLGGLWLGAAVAWLGTL